jgi:hypothetical protein
MSVPEGVFIIVVKCADCGVELNRSNPLTKADYTMAVLSAPICTGSCPNGCRATFADCNLNTTHEWVREDGTPIPRETTG